MPKLHLKRTPEEEAARKLRKASKKSHKKRTSTHNRSRSPLHKRPRRSDEPQERPWDSSDGETEYGPQPSTSTTTNPRPISPRPAPHAYKPDYEQIRAEMEEQKFREKMCGAFEDDERLDSLEARLNDFAHVPDRWRIGGIPGKGKTRYYEEDNDEFLKMDPRYMDEEEYAEWIRAGMYRCNILVLITFVGVLNYLLYFQENARRRVCGTAEKESTEGRTSCARKGGQRRDSASRKACRGGPQTEETKEGEQKVGLRQRVVRQKMEGASHSWRRRWSA